MDVIIYAPVTCQNSDQMHKNYARIWGLVPVDSIHILHNHVQLFGCSNETTLNSVGNIWHESTMTGVITTIDKNNKAYAYFKGDMPIRLY